MSSSTIQSVLQTYRRAMEALYWTCAVIASIALVLVSAVIPYSVYTRYILNRAASWPEPMAILLSIVLTFFGAAVCYRDSLHMRVAFFLTLMPAVARKACLLISEGLVAGVCVFMTVWGYSLCEATWHQGIDAFPSLSVGVTYLPIPIGGVITFLFVFERMMLGGPVLTQGTHAAAPFE